MSRTIGLPLNNLARLYDSQGKYAEVEPLHRRSLVMREKALGKDHPNLATVLENMAKCSEEMGKKDEAKRYTERARQIRSKLK